MLDGTLLAYLSALFFGTALGFVCGLIPGLGSRVGLILAIPLCGFWDPYPAAVFLIAMHAVVHTSSSIPTIAFALPTSGADAATVLDGYPLARMGRAGEALGASLSASAIGGVLGAFAFILAVPIARPIVSSFGPPEFLLLSLMGISLISAVSREGMLHGLVVAAIGVLCAMVGLSIRTGEPRLAFGLPGLWDGLDLPALVAGLFIIPEMLTPSRFLDEAAARSAKLTTISEVLKGMVVALRYRAILLRSSLYGIAIGLMPGLGASISVWLSYGYAARTARSEIPFGEGAIAGVVAPEAANNSKEGGAMIPTLFFGIPGSSSMAIMMAALALAGVAVGPRMLGQDIALTYLLGGAVVASNLIAIPLFFVVVPWIVRFSAVRREMIAPFAIVIGVTASLIHEPSLITHAQLLVATALGLVLRWANWPRAPFILGFVVGDLLETSSYQTAVIWGWSAAARPMTIVLAFILVGWVSYLLARRKKSRAVPAEHPDRRGAILPIAFFAIASLAMLDGNPTDRMPVLAISAVGIALAAVILLTPRRHVQQRLDHGSLRHAWLVGAFLMANPLLGLTASSAIFLTLLLHVQRMRTVHIVPAVLLFIGLQLVLLTLVLDIGIERDILGRGVWWMLGR
ncbi:tripartite tricarboxylate transporter permease [Dongia deserti]|uniref:tripartite tricarboxylate transporter permease n=1 Tax=Dongia deserti TaxID=2268030 RepID=UPI000E649540|nr:tripartite tricarboxylate transporter permease [Dongia deserti]